jgi:predicted DNA binding CopG/RHH family protein
METDYAIKSVNVKNVPADLWQRLKVQAAAEGITLQVALAKAIEQYVRAA